MAAQPVRVEGLRELQRAFARADRHLKKDLRDRLKTAAEPVKIGAERLSVEKIRGVRAGDRWARMRVGVTQRAVYVAPKERGVKSRGGYRAKRPNLAPLMLDRAMNPALDQNIDRVVAGVEDLLENVGRTWERG